MATPDRGLRDKALNIINNVGQYGPLDATIDSYKQAADYADDARKYSELALSGVEDLQAQITKVTELSVEVDNLNDKVEESYTKITGLDVDAVGGTSASAIYDKDANKIHFTIPAGKDGVDGRDGVDGQNGVNGKSSYQSYLDTTSDNPKLSEADWVASLHGKDGINGTNGTNGTNGYSAYELAVISGYDGTLDEFNDLNTKSLDRNQNLAELTNVAVARTNLDVNSKSEVASAISSAVDPKASKGANSDITALTGLTVALSVAQGGTGGKTAADARANISAAKSGSNSDITALTGLTGPLDIKKDGQSTTQAITFRQFSRNSLLQNLIMRMAAKETIKFAAFGDSTTDGAGTTSFTPNPVDASGNAVGQIDHNTTAPNAWPAVLQSLLREVYSNNNISVFNAGYNGRKLIDDWAINNYDKAITNNPNYGKPDAVFVDFGLNDFSVNVNAAPDYNTYFAKHRTLLDFILAKGTLPILLTSGPTALTNQKVASTDNYSIVKILNEGKKQLAEEYNIPILDKAECLKSWAKSVKSTTWQTAEPDYLHFGDAGNSIQAQFILTKLFHNFVDAKPGCRESINWQDSRSNNVTGGIFVGSNTKFGNNRSYATSEYTASQVLTTIYVWCTSQTVKTIYRAIDSDGSTQTNSAKIRIYEYATKTYPFDDDIPNKGFPDDTSIGIRFSDQPHNLISLDYGLYRIQYIAPPTLIPIYVGHFDIIDGWNSGRYPSWTLGKYKDFREVNLLKNSGHMFFYAGTGTTTPYFGVAPEDADGSNVLCTRYKNVDLMLGVALGAQCGIVLLSNRGWYTSQTNTPHYTGGLMLYKDANGVLSLVSVRRPDLGADPTFTVLATASTATATSDSIINYKISFVRTSSNLFISVSTVGDAVTSTQILTYTVPVGTSVLFPSAGVFGGYFVNRSSGSTFSGVRCTSATALYFNS